ncbi:TIGR03943 family putative permease subunit [Aneurinibacillus danicus]|uniref:TIGR03943 family protein n=1 Tax=Aneurinibacillus danicus TaxID=267746 RepID=A0A511VD20_9BACL|nr:TIGR03943 family protein [Aneurinibacillus danicus]GEN36787.1 TIGR03943 family protein [Aneurinibacillus danicus]
MMRSESWQFDVGRFAQGMILLNFALFLYKVIKTGEINRLVAPSFVFLTVGMMVLICLMTVYAFVTCLHRNGEESRCDCCDRPLRSPLRLSWLLLMVPSVLGICFPVSSLGTSMLDTARHTVPQEKDRVPSAVTPPLFDNRLLSLSQSHSSEKAAELSLLDMQEHFYDKKEQYIKRPYRLTGIVYHPPGWPSERIILMRFAISCCAADAIPIGVIAESPVMARLKDNTWVNVQGGLNVRQMPGADALVPLNWTYGQVVQPVLTASQVEVIPEPAEPYLSVPVIDLTGGES